MLNPRHHFAALETTSQIGLRIIRHFLLGTHKKIPQEQIAVRLPNLEITRLTT